MGNAIGAGILTSGWEAVRSAMGQRQRVVRVSSGAWKGNRKEAVSRGGCVLPPGSPGKARGG